jgi:broad-specificity NMP kinase
MKNIYLIGGTMGVGKTTTCQIIKNKLNNCVFLDGVGVGICTLFK